MLLKLSDLLRANMENDKYCIEFYTDSGYRPFLFGLYKHTTTDFERQDHVDDILKYPCEACGRTLVVLHITDSGITGCIDDHYKPINEREYPQICRECEQKARQRLGLKGG